MGTIKEVIFTLKYGKRVIATAGNENIKRYVNPNYPHDSTITNMPEDKKAEIISLLEGWLGK